MRKSILDTKTEAATAASSQDVMEFLISLTELSCKSKIGLNSRGEVFEYQEGDQFLVYGIDSQGRLMFL